MKKLTASAILIVLAFVTVNAQTVARASKKELKADKVATEKSHIKSSDGVGTLTKDNFYSDFGNVANVKWIKGAPFDEAVFIKDGQKTTAFYDYSSKLVGTTNIKKFTDLPANAQKEIQKRYKGFVTGAVVLFEDNQANTTSMTLYGHEFDGNDHFFVTVTKGDKEEVLMVNMSGNVSYFKKMS
ncbi:hypothetical protein [Dyadobacter luticola]|uniref:Beta-lactamase-inhibitor-like PepSY-like domain-containing protein n=1 Tax=Dyadobacter luticola TaxID=1979387 RepID=A0A5R9L1G2_9BACT|nr:hypothetical protein [Dyadobacter luticola]TLV02251.1 hypothetical protein FEN17_01005 [Dyadobacter luticola]